MGKSKSSPERSHIEPSCCKMVGRRTLCCITTSFIISFFVLIYFSYFKHPPPDELMRMNSRRRFSSGQRKAVTAEGMDTDDHVAEVTGRTIPDKGKPKWEKFLLENNFVSIGEVFNKCDTNTQQTLGTVIMVKDDVYGGVKARIYINFTLDEDLVEGSEFYIDVKYNGNDLYDNHWDLCTVENDDQEREFYCPIEKGQKKYTDDKKIPNYLPKGQYQTSAWIKNPDGETILSGYADFII